MIMCNSSSPAFHQAWGVPAGMTNVSPATWCTSLPAIRALSVPQSTVYCSLCCGWMCAAATNAPGWPYTSISNDAPPGSREVLR
jgi:hypothetical protein